MLAMKAGTFNNPEKQALMALKGATQLSGNRQPSEIR